MSLSLSKGKTALGYVVQLGDAFNPTKLQEAYEKEYCKTLSKELQYALTNALRDNSQTIKLSLLKTNAPLVFVNLLNRELAEALHTLGLPPPVWDAARMECTFDYYDMNKAFELWPKGVGTIVDDDDEEEANDANCPKIINSETIRSYMLSLHQFRIDHVLRPVRNAIRDELEEYISSFSMIARPPLKPAVQVVWSQWTTVSKQVEVQYKMHVLHELVAMYGKNCTLLVQSASYWGLGAKPVELETNAENLIKKAPQSIQDGYVGVKLMLYDEQLSNQKFGANDVVNQV